MSTRIVFETHSISEDNELGLASGWTHGPLSEQGRELARGLGARRRDDGIDTVFASDLHRALETAILAFEGETIPILLDWRLRECDYGQLHAPARGRDAPRPGPVPRDAVSRRRELAGGDQPRRSVPRRPPDALGRHPRADHRPRRDPLGPRPLPATASRSKTSSTRTSPWQEGWEYVLPERSCVSSPDRPVGNSRKNGGVRRSRSGVRASGTRRSRRRGARGGSRARARR